jgi:hypothetical protein
MLSHLRMSGTSFRPRPLDVNRPIPVIRKEVEDDDMITISRSVPELPTGMDMAEEAVMRNLCIFRQSFKIFYFFLARILKQMCLYFFSYLTCKIQI